MIRLVLSTDHTEEERPSDLEADYFQISSIEDELVRTVQFLMACYWRAPLECL